MERKKGELNKGGGGRLIRAVENNLLHRGCRPSLNFKSPCHFQ